MSRISGQYPKEVGRHFSQDSPADIEWQIAIDQLFEEFFAPFPNAIEIADSCHEARLERVFKIIQGDIDQGRS